MTNIQLVAETQTIVLDTVVSSEIILDSGTQEAIVVETPTTAISVVSSGPQGPPGSASTLDSLVNVYAISKVDGWGEGTMQGLYALSVNNC